MPGQSGHHRKRSQQPFGQRADGRAHTRRHAEKAAGPAPSKKGRVSPSRGPSGDVETADGRERLQKVLASAGIASRRECEQLIVEGRVEVDRQVVTELGTRVDPQQQEIRVDGESLPRPKLVYFAVNKPTGVVSTSRDPAGRPRVIDLMPPDVPRVFCVGRLDITSEGLIIVTNDGELANALTHPRHGVEKIYHVVVAGQVEPEVLTQLRQGLHLAEGFAHAKHIRIKSRHKRSSVLEMILDEGRNREVRRLLARVGHKVQRLKRVAVGPVRLGEMPAGAVRPLTKKEIQAIAKIAHGEPRARPVESRRSAPEKKRSPARSHHANRTPQGDQRTVIG
jgi:23S rRNA pseudouridine2605 synthase